VRQFFDELRYQRVKRRGITVIREVEAFQRADNLRFIHQRLVVRERLRCFGDVEIEQRGQKIVRFGITRKNGIHLPGQIFEFPGQDQVVCQIKSFNP